MILSREKYFERIKPRLHFGFEKRKLVGMLPCSQFKSTKFKEQVAVQSRFNFLFCEEQSLNET